MPKPKTATDAHSNRINIHSLRPQPCYSSNVLPTPSMQKVTRSTSPRRCQAPAMVLGCFAGLSLGGLLGCWLRKPSPGTGIGNHKRDEAKCDFPIIDVSQIFQMYHRCIGILMICKLHWRIVLLQVLKRLRPWSNWSKEPQAPRQRTCSGQLM